MAKDDNTIRAAENKGRNNNFRNLVGWEQTKCRFKFALYIISDKKATYMDKIY
jgi:hypothetical protein